MIRGEETDGVSRLTGIDCRMQSMKMQAKERMR